jgi:hypothetical protein
MEYIVYSHIIDHLEIHGILADHQHGFRRQRSCEAQLVNTIEEVTRSTDNRQQIYMLTLDFSKAFDTVSHQRLLQKMHHYGIKGNILKCVSGWLTQRHQKVCVDGEESINKSVRSGVLQGTVLGLLYFLIYINDMGSSRTSSLRLFADDSLLYRSINCIEDTTKFQENLTELVQW